MYTLDIQMDIHNIVFRIFHPFRYSPNNAEKRIFSRIRIGLFRGVVAPPII